MGFGESLICSFIILTIISNNLPVSVNGQALSRTSYINCPFADQIVQSEVLMRPNLAPAILKLHYSDCFVEGCDGSVLLTGPNTEKTAGANIDLRGFEVIEAIKRRLEFVCSGVVSCSDILALAAREAVVLRNGPRWDVKIGRKDGRVSLAANVKNLPSNNDNITVLLSKFKAFGLNTDDFVALTGGSTIGKPACTYISELIFKKNETKNERPLLVYLGKEFVTQLRRSCYMYYLTETPHFHSLDKDDAVLKTDLSLLTDPNFYRVFLRFVTTNEFRTRFARAMDKMSRIGVKTIGDPEGEVRLRNCYEVNPKTFSPPNM